MEKRKRPLAYVWAGCGTPTHFKLLGQVLVEATDRTGAGSHSQQRLGHFSYLMGARPSDEHLRQSFCNMRFIAPVAVKRLGVELALPISRHLDIFEPASGCDQIAGVGAVAIAFALGTTFSPRGSDESIELLCSELYLGMDLLPDIQALEVLLELEDVLS
jgi:hypothetical protein